MTEATGAGVGEGKYVGTCGYCGQWVFGTHECKTPMALVINQKRKKVLAKEQVA